MSAARGASTSAARWFYSSRQTWLRPFLVAGVLCVIGGGLLAAATAYVTTQKTAWATAYVVLVGGVAQIGLGAAVAWLAPVASRRAAWWAFGGWNLGNAGVLTGQLTGTVVLTDLGTALLVAALVLVLVAVRSRHRTDPGAADAAHPAVLHLFRALVVLLVITMPIGVVLAHLN